MDNQTPNAAAAGLQEPIRHFSGAHGHIISGLLDLQHLPEMAVVLERARTVASATLEMFDKQVLQHHAEEEQELFVSVQRSCRDAREGHQVRELVDRLTLEHRQIERLWSRIRPAVALTAAGKVHGDSALADEVRSLCELYGGHAKLEEEVFLPLADTILGRNANHMAALVVSLHMRNAPLPRSYI